LSGNLTEAEKDAIISTIVEDRPAIDPAQIDPAAPDDIIAQSIGLLFHEDCESNDAVAFEIERELNEIINEDNKLDINSKNISSKKLEVKDIFKMVATEKKSIQKPEFHFWRQVEELYFVLCSIQNINSYYQRKLDGIWADSTKILSKTLEGELEPGVDMKRFRSGATFLQNQLMKDEKMLVSSNNDLNLWMTNRDGWERILGYIKQVEQGFDDGIHQYSHDLLK
jgi:hypothetical protein